ncbi:MAG TPA: SCO family protein [Bacteroidia bacterium]|jgi:protein SCO1/2|nr:SCO family protein [Bacteroidia bacterium]
MKSNAANILLVMLAVSILVGGYFYFGNGAKVRTLNYFEPVEKALQGHNDSLGRFVVYDFSLTDQTGRKLTRADFSNSVCVVDFFFTSCQGICPRMNNQMQRVYEKYKGNKNVQFISHTVNPENDSVPVLAKYASDRHVDNSQWHFVTGDKAQLYMLARKSYLISDTKGDGGKEDFVHSQNFALIDKQGHIRGLYDGLDSVEVNRLMVDMDVLLEEK